jgi:hypothetical protein
MLSVLVDRYQATGDARVLEQANEFAEYLFSRQHPDGYYGGYGMHPYTSVLYVAKAIMELMAAEKPLAEGSPVWRERYDRHYDSVRRAMDDLVRRGSDVKTEGEGTFEDGAVSCTATQLAMFALLEQDPAERLRYQEAAERFLTAHACLTRLLDADTRSRGATARWWEAWNDAKTGAQMMTSPHGWSGWRLYGVYYLYLLTGREEYLRGIMDGLGAGAQLMEWPSGTLRQAFVIDPHLAAGERVPDPSDPTWGRYEERILSEEYLRTIGGWYGRRTEGDTYMDRVGWAWTGDGIPYEIFKAMEEIALTSAYVLEREDGSFLAYNGAVSERKGVLTVRPSEAIASRVHLNLRSPHDVAVSFADGPFAAPAPAGMTWVGPGGVPEDIR